MSVYLTETVEKGAPVVDMLQRSIFFLSIDSKESNPVTDYIEKRVKDPCFLDQDPHPREVAFQDALLSLIDYYKRCDLNGNLPEGEND